MQFPHVNSLPRVLCLRCHLQVFRCDPRVTTFWVSRTSCWWGDPLPRTRVASHSRLFLRFGQLGASPTLGLNFRSCRAFLSYHCRHCVRPSPFSPNSRPGGDSDRYSYSHRLTLSYACLHVSPHFPVGSDRPFRAYGRDCTRSIHHLDRCTEPSGPAPDSVYFPLWFDWFDHLKVQRFPQFAYSTVSRLETGRQSQTLHLDA